MTPQELLASTNNIIAILKNASTGAANDVASRQQQRTPLARGAGPVGAPALNSYDYNRFYKPTIEPMVAQLEQAGRTYALNQALSDALKIAANNYRNAYSSAANKASPSSGTSANPNSGGVFTDFNGSLNPQQQTLGITPQGTNQNLQVTNNPFSGNLNVVNNPYTGTLHVGP